jgi:hypothetical protein
MQADQPPEECEAPIDPKPPWDAPKPPDDEAALPECDDESDEPEPENDERDDDPPLDEEDDERPDEHGSAGD